MEFRGCLLSLLIFAVLLIQRSYADIIDVILPSNLYPIFTYTLDVDPIDRLYRCIDANNGNNSDTVWLDYTLSNLGSFLDIYSVYEDFKTTGRMNFKCFSTTSNRYLGSVTIYVIEGGHISITHENITTNYSSNQHIVQVVENTHNLVIMCSARTGDLLFNYISQSFPSVTIAIVTLHYNITRITCRRIIDGEVLLEVSLDLFVVADSISTMYVITETMVTSSSSNIIISSQIKYTSAPVNTGITNTTLDSLIFSSTLTSTSIPIGSSYGMPSSQDATIHISSLTSALSTSYYVQREVDTSQTNLVVAIATLAVVVIFLLMGIISCSIIMLVILLNRKYRTRIELTDTPKIISPPRVDTKEYIQLSDINTTELPHSSTTLEHQQTYNYGTLDSVDPPQDIYSEIPDSHFSSEKFVIVDPRYEYENLSDVK